MYRGYPEESSTEVRDARDNTIILTKGNYININKVKNVNINDFLVTCTYEDCNNTIHCCKFYISSIEEFNSKLQLIEVSDEQT